MSPESEHRPATRAQDLGRLDIALTIPVNLYSPKLLIGFGRHIVMGAAVPKASVDEDRDATLGEQHVGRATQIGLHTGVDSIAEAASVEEPPDCEFWLRVTSSVSLHDLSSCRRGRSGRFHVEERRHSGILAGRRAGAEVSVVAGTVVPMSIDVRRPLAVDLFAGAGGLSLGLEQAGYEIAAAVEYDPIHAAVHEFNFPYGKTFCADVSKITGDQIREQSEIGDQEIHLVAGGPPCQGISMIGRRAIDDPRNMLLKEFVRVVLELRPRYFVMENVAGLMVGGHRQLVDEVVEMVESTGEYRVVAPIRVLQAADFGAPQSRRRVFVVGARKDVAAPEYPAATHTPRTISGIIPKTGRLPLGPSVLEAIGDLPDADRFDELLHDDNVDEVTYGDAGEYAARLRGSKKDPSDFSRPRPRLVDGLTSSARTIHTKKSIDRFADAEPGTTEKVSRFLRLHPDGLCNTLRAGTASDRGAYTAPRPIHPTFPRVITVREAARLHGYPDWFRFHVTKWNGFREIGNSVPARLGRAVGSAILKADGITPERGKPVKLGSTSLLYMTAGQAHTHFGLEERVIPQRDRKVG